MKKSSIVTIVIVAVLIIVALLVYGYHDSTTTDNDQTSGTSSTTTQVSTETSQPSILSLSPMSGATGDTVVITGTGFDLTSNSISFGTSTGRHHPDGSDVSIIAKGPSSDGTSLTFTVPRSGPSGIVCDAGNHCIAISAIRTLPGTYPVVVSNKNGTSNTAYFTVK